MLGEVPMNGAKILVADDSATVRTQLRRALVDAGYEQIVEARNGIEAVQYLTDDLPDLAILDIRMPEMDGFGVCQQMKRMGPPWTQVPIIFLTSSSSHALELLGKQWGAYVPKPVSVSKLLGIVESLLKEKAKLSADGGDDSASTQSSRPETVAVNPSN